MAEQSVRGVAFPRTDEDGARSTTAFGRSVVQAALADVDPVGARAAEQETSWRSGYLSHFRRLVEAGIDNPDGARQSALTGVTAVVDGMRWVSPDSTERALSTLIEEPGEPQVSIGTDTVAGSGAPVNELVVPRHGEQLRGDALRRATDQWVADGVMEPSAAAAIRAVVAHPEWLALRGRTIVAMGAGAEVGPTPVLLGWGATVAGIDLPRPEVWARVVDQAAAGAGTLLMPVRGDSGTSTERAGLDLLTELPEVIDWVEGLPGSLVLGSYLYADGGTNVRLSAAGDVLGARLQRHRPDTTLAFLATPTDVFAVPREAVQASVRAYEARSRWSKVPGRGLRAISGGRLLRRAYRPGADPGICDALVTQQGPNYALGKRMQRWRATAERAAGRPVSMNIAPPTRTVSVVKNRALAAAYAGAHRFGLEVFEPDTTRVLMAALLVHDLNVPPSTGQEPWQEEANQAVHGGLWRSPFAPRSALGLAALLGYGSTRS
ncbi:MAG: hypothetical protein QM714_11445 [Nocardioides sp.]|uniref:hypothetical protein n=1 Tax=Nocardioides sp. TaxID=35761 RepID=UPI0039E36C94